MKELYTKRLIIRYFTPDDANVFQEIIISEGSSKYAIYDHEFPTSLDEVKKINHRFSLENKFLAVRESTDQKVIGSNCLNGEKKMLDLGFCFNVLYKGKGYATEASTAIIDYAFNTLQVEDWKVGQ
jgi:RimJ/RimL family protein N-acetyltransferase